MGIEDALDAAPSGGHRELWLAARPMVRRHVCRLVVVGADPREILVLIADRGTVITEVVQMDVPEMVLQVGDPFVSVLVGKQRGVAAAVLRGVDVHLAALPRGSFSVVTVPAGATPMIAVCAMVDRRTLS